MSKGTIIVLSGPSGSGKTTLYKMLLACSKRLVRSVSVTTRPRRSGEVQGKDYIFVSPKMFAYKKRAGHFLEDEKVFEHFYGTPRHNVMALLKEGKHVLLCIDVKGAKTVTKYFPEAISIFIKTKTLQVLKERLARRASETSGVMKLRLARAQEELLESKYYQHVIVNDDLQESFVRIKKIIFNLI